MKIDSYAALHKICVGAQRETEHIYKIRPSAVTSDLFLIVSTVCSLLDFICHLLIGGSLCNTVTLNSQPAVYHTIGTWSILIHLKEAMVVLCGGERSGSILKRGIVSASHCKKNVCRFYGRKLPKVCKYEYAGKRYSKFTQCFKGNHAEYNLLY